MIDVELYSVFYGRAAHPAAPSVPLKYVIAERVRQERPLLAGEVTASDCVHFSLPCGWIPGNGLRFISHGPLPFG